LSKAKNDRNIRATRCSAAVEQAALETPRRRFHAAAPSRKQNFRNLTDFGSFEQRV